MSTTVDAANQAVLAARQAADKASKAVAEAADKARKLSVIGGVRAGYRIEVYRDRKREYRWRLLARNRKIIADSGEGYKRKSDCLHGIDLVSGVPIGIPVKDLT